MGLSNSLRLGFQVRFGAGINPVFLGGGKGLKNTKCSLADRMRVTKSTCSGFLVYEVRQEGQRGWVCLLTGGTLGPGPGAV